MSGPISTKSAKDKDIEQAEGRLQGGDRRSASSHPKQDTLVLQRSAGNQAMDRLMQAAKGNVPPESEAVPPAVLHVLRAPGLRLDPATRESMEWRFGHDLGQVRVHTDGKASGSARAVNAQAYTVGPDVVFGEGRYAPGTGAGQQLLAHELAHVVQQATEPTLMGRVWRYPDENDKIAKKKSHYLKLARESIDRGLRALQSGKPKRIQTGCVEVRAGIENLTRAAQHAQDPEKNKILRVARGLAALVGVASASYRKRAGQKTLREAFAKGKAKGKMMPVAGSETIPRGQFAEAAKVYRALPQDFTDIFPDLAFTDHGLLVSHFATAMEQRLNVMESMKKAGAAPKSYPPTPAEVEDFFSKLDAAGAKNAEINKAYEDYAKAFFKHRKADFDPKKMGTAQVYAGKQSVIGTIFTDCDGYVRLGVQLLTLAGFKLEKVIVGIMNVKTMVKGRETYSDVHAVGQLTRDGETVFVSSYEVWGHEKGAFGSVDWDHPDAVLIKGEGKTLAEANKNALANMKGE